jgi:hypothetical protein
MQLDGQYPMSSTRNQHSRSERHGDIALVSRTPEGGPGSRRNDNRQLNKGHPSAHGNNEQEVQQPTRNQHGARHQGQDPLEANLHDAPMINLRQKINKGRDARRVIELRRKDRTGRCNDDDDSDCFPAFTTSITDKSYPKDFKPVEIPKYDGKQDPHQWIRCYSVASEVSMGSNSTKSLYFLVALESAPLMWLGSLKPNSIDSWEDLKRAFIDNFQGSMIRVGTRHDLSQVKKEMNEIPRSYTRRFFETRTTIANITDEHIIRWYQNRLFLKHTYHDFGRNHPTTAVELRDMMARWPNQEDEENDRYPKRNHDKQGNSNGHFDKSQRNHLGNTRKRKPDHEVMAIKRNPHGKKSGNNHSEYKQVMHK